MKNNEGKIKLKNIIAYEKAQMLPLNFTVSYILTPIYLVISLLLMIGFGISIEIDDGKYLFQGLLCLGGFAFISIVFLASVPFVKKKAIEHELNEYNFDFLSIEPQNVWNFSTDDFSLRFDENGMYVDDQLFYYNHLNKAVITSNDCQRIGIYLEFSLSEKIKITMRVNPVTLKMLDSLNIKLDNQHILDYIVTNKADAFQQIYNKGYVVARFY